MADDINDACLQAESHMFMKTRRAKLYPGGGEDAIGGFLINPHVADRIAEDAPKSQNRLLGTHIQSLAWRFARARLLLTTRCGNGPAQRCLPDVLPTQARDLRSHLSDSTDHTPASCNKNSRGKGPQGKEFGGLPLHGGNSAFEVRAGMGPTPNIFPTLTSRTK